MTGFSLRAQAFSSPRASGGALLTLLLAIAPMAFGAKALSAQAALTPAQMRADLSQLAACLQAKHPGLYRYATKQAFRTQFDAVMQQTATAMPVLQFYRSLAPLVAGIGCGHTATRPSGEFLQAIARTAKQLPLRVQFVGDRTYVLAWQDPDEQRVDGCELLGIDGCSLRELRARMLPSVRGDGNITTGRLRELEKQFALYYSILIDTKVDKPFELKVSRKGESATVVTVNGTRFRPPTRPDRGAPIARQLVTPEIGLLSVRTFSAGAMKDASVDYRDYLANVFAELHERKVRKLILDLRGNSGGTDQMGALLVSYLCTQPFGYFGEIEVTSDYDGVGGVQKTDDGRRLITAHPGLRLQQPAKHAFGEQLVVLIDGNTFSTAADVATVLHYQKRGTFLGEECGGGYDGNNSGVMHTEILKHSKVAIRVPLWKYTTAVPGHQRAGRGVPVEATTAATIEDVLASKDVVLANAMERLRGH